MIGSAQAPKPRVIIAGGSGLIGTGLVPKLEAAGFIVQILSRKPSAGKSVQWLKENGDEDLKPMFATANVVINLSGSSINTKWTPEAKKEIVESRTSTIKAIEMLLPEAWQGIWINASAIGFYGDRGDELLTEESIGGTGFLAETTKIWEDTFFAASPHVRKATIRIGVVMANGGGALPVLRGLTKSFLGGSAGNGQQWMSWIHLEDLVSLFVFLAVNRPEGKIFNGVSPTAVTNEEFMAALRKSEGRPWSPPAPAPAIRILEALGGPPADLALTSARVSPEAAVKAGFEFEFQDISATFESLKKS